jgi:hypothetical protein
LKNQHKRAKEAATPQRSWFALFYKHSSSGGLLPDNPSEVLSDPLVISI